MIDRNSLGIAVACLAVKAQVILPKRLHCLIVYIAFPESLAAV